MHSPGQRRRAAPTAVKSPTGVRWSARMLHLTYLNLSLSRADGGEVADGGQVERQDAAPDLPKPKPQPHRRR